MPIGPSSSDALGAGATSVLNQLGPDVCRWQGDHPITEVQSSRPGVKDNPRDEV
jgi:hypothetical protein